MGHVGSKKDKDGWNAIQFMAPDGQLFTKYTYKRKPAPSVELNSQIAIQLAGYDLIEKDLSSVLEWLAAIQELASEQTPGFVGHQIGVDRSRCDLVKGLYVAALTFYGKCFTACKGRRIQLNRNMMDLGYRPAHDQIMQLRHNFAAHSGAEKWEEVRVVLVLHPKKHSGTPPRIYRELKQLDQNTALAGDISFGDVVEHIRDRVLKKLELLNEKIMDDEILPKGQDFWYRKAK